ncbi:MAG: replication initiation protein [Saprospiraceae bacterium]
MAKKQKKNNKGIVLIKKANNLIESRYKFDIWETRFFLSVLAQIRREDQEFQVYRIWYKDVIKAFGLKSGDSYRFLREAAQSLMGKSFFVSYETEGVKRERQYHILREIDYLQAGQEEKIGKQIENHEYIDVTVEQKMRPLLLQLQKNFTAYDLRNIVKLGVYPVRVYELLKQYESIGKRKLLVEDMKKMFEVGERYKLFGDFFRWVIKPSVNEINKYTDLTIIEVEKIKEGRKVQALNFVFRAKGEEELRKVHREAPAKQLEIGFEEVLPKSTNETEKDRLFNIFHADVVQRFGVTPSVLLGLLEEYTEEQVSQAIRVTNRAKYNKQISTSIAGFFIYALKNGYTDEKEEAMKKQAEDQLKQKMQELKDEKSIKLNERIKEVTVEQPDITARAIEVLKEEATLIIIEQKQKALKRPLTLEDYRQDIILRELVKGKIVALAKDRFSDILAEFEEKKRELVH